MIDLKWLCALVLILLGSACTDPASDAFRFGLAARPQTSIRALPRTRRQPASTRLLYDRLVDFNDAFEPVPSLADWEQLSPTHYRFQTQNERSSVSMTAPC